MHRRKRVPQTQSPAGTQRGSRMWRCRGEAGRGGTLRVNSVVLGHRGCGLRGRHQSSLMAGACEAKQQHGASPQQRRAALAPSEWAARTNRQRGGAPGRTLALGASDPKERTPRRLADNDARQGVIHRGSPALEIPLNQPSSKCFASPHSGARRVALASAGSASLLEPQRSGVSMASMVPPTRVPMAAAAAPHVIPGQPLRCVGRRERSTGVKPGRCQFPKRSLNVARWRQA